VLYRHALLLPFAGFAYATISDRHDPAPFVASVSPTPLLVIHGTHDPIIAPAFGRVLFDLAREPREFWLIEGGTHVDALRRPEVRARLLRYFERVLP
jgi:fermentation-respiration switch protein FrsA (DUF1100 family)